MPLSLPALPPASERVTPVAHVSAPVHAEMTESPSVPGPVEGPTTSEMRKRPAPTAAAWLLAAAGVVALVAYLANRSTPPEIGYAHAADRPSGASHASAVGTKPVAAPAPTVGEPSAAPQPPLGAVTADTKGGELSLVVVRVTSQPSGARLRVAGGEEVCASTPCSFDAVLGRPLSLLARRGRSQALTTITPVAETELHLVLETVPGAKTATGASTPGTGAAPASAVSANEDRDDGHDDLKIPEMFRGHR